MLLVPRSDRRCFVNREYESRSSAYEDIIKHRLLRYSNRQEIIETIINPLLHQ